jgi:hypothetical protein
MNDSARAPVLENPTLEEKFMTASPIPMSGRQTGAIVVLLAASSLAITLGFACALPFAAFATISAMLFAPRAAIGALVSVWLMNQVVGFTLLHYPTDASTIAWGFALGAIALLSLGAAFLVLSRLDGVVGAVASFLAAFVVYEGAIYVVCVATGTGVGSFTTPIVTRIFLINAVSFGVLLAARELLSRIGLRRRTSASASLRHTEDDEGGAFAPSAASLTSR